MGVRFPRTDTGMLKFRKKKKTTDKDSDKQEQDVAPTADASAPVETTPAPSVDDATGADSPQASPATDTGTAEATASDTEPDAGEDESTASGAGAQPAADTTTEKRNGWRQRLSGSGFARGLSSLFTRNPRLDDSLLDELETTLITADVGVNLSLELVEALRTRLQKREFADSNALLQALREDLTAQLLPVEKPLTIGDQTPFVMLVAGVNGVGKTTTIGKLTHHYRNAGLDVALAAGDTFRAAAVEQLQTWGERNQTPVFAQEHGADAASVVYDALAATRARGGNLLIADTAGRLHTQGGLMDELGKINRVVKKLDAGAPHEVLMVIDGTTGQNAISQLRSFHESLGVTGLVVTKLDGTAKGGVVFQLAHEFNIPIRYVGLGESLNDLRQFDARAFVDGLLPGTLGNGT